jgi:hypothetical protein
MDAGLVVVVAVLGVFPLVPLGFAWVRRNPRRWARVEGVLGREPKGSARLARWSMGLWFGASVQTQVEDRAEPLGPGAGG